MLDDASFKQVLKDNGIKGRSEDPDTRIDDQIQIELMDTEISDLRLGSLNLSCSSLARCTITNSKFEKVDFSAALFINSRFENCTFSMCSFAKADFRSAVAVGCAFQKCEFIKADFTSSVFNGCDFTGSTLNWAFIINADFRNVNWTGTRLNGVKLASTKLYNGNRHMVAESKNIEFSNIDLSQDGNGPVVANEDVPSILFCSEFEKLDFILVLDLSGDPWNDDAYILVTDILNAFTPMDWEQLNSCWRTKKESWKALLADALSGAPSDKGMGILLTMIASENDTVAESAALALKGLKEHVALESLTPGIKERILKIADKSPFNRTVMGDFVRKIHLG